MKTPRTAMVLLLSVAAGACNRDTPTPLGIDKTEVRRMAGKERVTFYTTYGFLDGEVWRIPLRAWIREDRKAWTVIDRLPTALGIDDPDELRTFGGRARDFVADSQSRERLTLRFDQDPTRRDRALTDDNGERLRTDLNGLVESTLTLSIAEATDFMAKQGSPDGWLTFRASSEGHEGAGRVHLIPPTGLSVVSDIDDTIKDTHVPAGAREVLRNTFFRPFVAAGGMAARYRTLGATAFHYVSGGPFQLYEPIAGFLLDGQHGFPEGTVHMKVVPKHLFEPSSWEALAKLVVNPDATFDHKIKEITTLMQRFPERRFVLIGDSGERDPDVYRQIKGAFGTQVQEIQIRDVIDDRTKRPERLSGMTIIAAPTISRDKS